MHEVDLTATAVVETTWLLANIEYYRAILEGVQTEVRRCGYLFARGEQRPSELPRLPEALGSLLQRAILRARIEFLEPLTRVDDLERRLDHDQDIRDGYGIRWQQSILAALWAQGIWIEAGSTAATQLQQSWEAFQLAYKARARQRAEQSQAINDFFDSVKQDVENKAISAPMS